MPVRVLLINPNQMQPPIAPIGLDYLADVLDQRGCEVRIVDLCFEADIAQPVADAIHHFRPHVIGITVRNTDDCYYAGQDFILPRVKEVVDAVKRVTRIPVVLGGVGFSIAPEQSLRFLGGDFGIEGEGEEAFSLLAARIAKGGDFTGIPGLLYYQRRELKRNTCRISPIDELPAFRRSYVDNPRYFEQGGQIGFETKRGCAMPCIYCCDPVSKGRIIRMRPPAVVAEELSNLLSQGIDCFHTCDSEFNLPEDHAKSVCDEITRAGLGEKIKWYAYCSPTPFSRELAGAMKEAGCAGIDFGVDSGDDAILAHLKRSFTSDDLRKTARICKDYEIPFMYDLLIGAPGETPGSLRRTIDLMKEIGPDCVGAAIGVRIYDGTRIAYTVRNEGPIATNSSLHGVKEDNDAFLKPLFYISPAVGPDVAAYAQQLVGDDPRFYFGSHDDPEKNYNYNDNNVLVNAIKQGYRGAYWDILRRLRLEQPSTSSQ